MALIYYCPKLIVDQETGRPVTSLKGTAGQVIARGNPASVPTIFEDQAGTTVITNSELPVTDDTFVRSFYVDEAFGPVSFWGGGVEVPLETTEGIAKRLAAVAETTTDLESRVRDLEENPGTGGGVDDGGIGQLVADPASATAQALAALYGAGIIVVDLDAPEVTEPEGALVIRIGSGPTPEPVVYARDLFERVVAAGWGAADIGGSWTVISTAKTSVSGGRARVQTVASETQGGMIPGFSQDDTEVHVVVALDSPTAGARIARVQQRRQSSTVFHQVSVRQYGSAHATSPGRVDVSFDESSYTTGVLTGVAAGALVHIRSRVTGSAPTTRQVKVWLDGTPEPSAWTATTTTATGPQSGGGYAGMYFYSTGSEPGTAQHSVDLFEVLGV